jgi:hypothetical protein
VHSRIAKAAEPKAATTLGAARTANDLRVQPASLFEYYNELRFHRSLEVLSPMEYHADQSDGLSRPIFGEDSS